MRRIIIILVSVIVLAGAAGFAVHRVLSSRARPHAGDNCARNLSKFGKLFYVYASDHDGRYPESWQAMADYQASFQESVSPELYLCQQSGDEPGPMGQVDSWCSFVLVSGLPTNAAANRLHAYCLPEHHGGRGANALFVDGSVMWIPENEFEEVVEAGGVEW